MMRSVLNTDSRALPAFTLIEVLVGLAIVGVLGVLVATLIGSVSQVWLREDARMQTNQSARSFFDMLSRELIMTRVGPRHSMIQNPPLLQPSVAGSDSLFLITMDGEGAMAASGYWAARNPTFGNMELRKLFVPLPDWSSAWAGKPGGSLVNTDQDAWPSQIPANDLEPGPGQPHCATIIQGLGGIWFRALNASGNPIPWWNSPANPGGRAGSPIKFHSAAHALPSQEKEYLHSSTLVRSHLAPAWIEATIVLFSPKELRRGIPLPAPVAVSSPEEVPGAAQETLRLIHEAGFPSARLFRKVIPVNEQGP
jgi:prepilin-type N-terminal cleavage/methylation domain-containing protein